MDERRQQNQAISNSRPDIVTARLSITMYTDPLCCWSWAMHKDWEAFLQQARPDIVTYKMAGLIPSWKHFSDHRNAISKPIQMGPEWMHACNVSGIQIDDRLWVTDPPQSSYPACLAVKAAEFQGGSAARHYFHLIQQAAMQQRRNIARQAVLYQVAVELCNELAEFDPDRFAKDMKQTETREALRRDIADWKYLNVGRLPAMIFQAEAGKGTILIGYQTLDNLLKANVLDKVG